MAVLVAVVAAATAGCSHDLEVHATLEMPPAVVPLPVAMGVYYPPELRTYHVSTGLGIHTFDADLGPPSIALFDQVFSSMFARVVTVAEHPTALDDTPDVAAMIVLHIERFQPYDLEPDERSPGTYTHIPAIIVYRARLYSPQGREIATWTVDGSGAFVEEFDEDELAWTGSVMEELTAVAMRGAAAKFIVGFHRQPEVAKWLEGLDLASSSPPT